MELINSITPHQWYLIGGLVASGVGAIGITEWVKRHHFKVKAEKLWTGFVFLNVTFWSFILTAVDALSSNLSQITHIGSLIPQVSPFVSHYAPTVTVVVLVLHTVASALFKWWTDRKQKKAFNIANLPDITPAVEAVSTPIPAQSFGTEAAQRNVIQL